MDSIGVVHLSRLVHVVAGVFWVGTALFTAYFLLPSVRAIGPAAGPILEQLVQVRRLPLFMMAATILSILSGVALYWRDSGGFSGPWMSSGPGMAFGFGGVMGIAAAAHGMAVTSPNAKRMGALAARMKSAGGPPAPEQIAEMQSLQAKIARSSSLGAVLVLIATAAMAVARYVP